MRSPGWSSEGVRPQLSEWLRDNRLSRRKKTKRECVFLLLIENWQVGVQHNRASLEPQTVSCQSYGEGYKSQRTTTNLSAAHDPEPAHSIRSTNSTCHFHVRDALRELPHRFQKLDNTLSTPCYFQLCFQSKI